MAYCRWSSDNFDCDVYAYKSAIGYETHIASNRLVGKAPMITSTLSEVEEYVKQSRARSEWLENAERKKIGLPYDGQSFTMYTLESFLQLLEELREMGYRFPDYVLAEVKEEIRLRDEKED